MRRVNVWKWIKGLLRGLGLMKQGPKPPVVPPVEPPPTPPEPPEPPKPPRTPLPRLTPDGILFRAGSAPWRWKGVTAFALYRRYLAEGPEAIRPFLEWAAGTGFNLLRVFGQFTLNSSDKASWLDPRREGERYWAGLDAFFDLCEDHRLYVEWVCLCDQQMAEYRLSVPVPERQAYLNRIVGTLTAHPNVVSEVMNEPPFNGGLDGLDGLTNLHPSASGFYDYDGKGPLRWVRDFVTLHPQRSDEWPRKIKDPMYELGRVGYQQTPAVRVPIVNDEPMGAAEVESDGRRSTNTRDFRDHGAVTGLFGVGGTFHCEDGMQAQVPGPKQQACAKAWLEGLNAIPVEAPTWAYSAGHLGDCPLAQKGELRVYTMTAGNRGVGVVVRKGYDGPPPTRNGWQVVKPLTEDAAIVELAR